MKNTFIFCETAAAALGGAGWGREALAWAVINSPPLGILISTPHRSKNRYLIPFPTQIKDNVLSIPAKLIRNFPYLHKNICAHKLTNFLHFISELISSSKLRAMKINSDALWAGWNGMDFETIYNFYNIPEMSAIRKNHFRFRYL